MKQASSIYRFPVNTGFVEIVRVVNGTDCDDDAVADLDGAEVDNGFESF